MNPREQLIVPCLWLDDQAEQAAGFYLDTFRDGRRIAVSRYPESFDNPGGRPRGSVLTVDFEAAGQRFTALNGGSHFAPNPSISFFVHVDAAQEAERLFSSLADGGEVLMPLETYPWSERYGWAQDRFGVSWQVITGRRGAGGTTIAPCLMFAGPQHGKAEEAMVVYAGIFPRTRVESVERYAAGEGPVGAVKHGRLALAGQEMVAMDSHIDHGFTFTEGLSLQVRCSRQDELDRYWDALSEGGEQGQCGWLKDRYGVSWQIVPIQLDASMAARDVGGRERVFRAMLGMKKLDIAALLGAFDGP